MQHQGSSKSHVEVYSAILIDFSNVSKVAHELIGGPEHAEAIVLRLIEEARRYVSRQLGYRVTRMIAVDRAATDDPAASRSVRALLGMGAEPRLIHASAGEQATSVELAIQAVALASGSPEIDTFVLISGDSWCVPLAHHLMHRGRNVIVAALETPSDADDIPSDLVECYFNTRKLLEKAGRIETNGLPVDSGDGDGYAEDQAADFRSIEMLPIEDRMARAGLEIIETYFGQYREVYLTPLLRKLTELLEEEDEPKSVINYLEECGAVWLEKRRGFPHNYTVLIVNEDHPDVIEVKDAFQRDGRTRYTDSRGEYDGHDNYYDDETYDRVKEGFLPKESSYERARD